MENFPSPHEGEIRQQTEAATHRGVLPRIGRPLEQQSPSNVLAGGWVIIGHLSAAADDLIQVTIPDTPIPPTNLQFELVTTEELYQGHGVWDTSSSAHSGEPFWERVRKAYYALIRLREASTSFSPDAEAFLLDHLLLLQVFDTIAPQISSILKSRDLEAELNLELLIDPDAPEVPVAYLNVRVLNDDIESLQLMRVWDTLSEMLHAELRRQGGIEGLDELALSQLGSRASVIVTTPSD